MVKCDWPYGPSQRQWLRHWHWCCASCCTCNDERAVQEERYNLHFGVGPKSPEWSKRAFGLASGCALDSPRRLTGCLGRIGGMDGSRFRDFRLCGSVNVYTFYWQSSFCTPSPSCTSRNVIHFLEFLLDLFVWHCERFFQRENYYKRP